jgi:hypothetical protein
MTYYARHSWEAKDILLKVNGGQSETLTLDVKDNGYTLCDPINDENIVIICDDEHSIIKED